ncbi:hypothetical protein Dda_6909 [Drechslerella dactyloides]|uniref:Uncharacterized protein n=1 Tax=Drechslerella dactyloides TaxID=74499 RepID=A0AAD6IX49_DREDA|nr:hypothetical protein Dda_6909 [Drechslerella dactyloides]
MLSDTMPNEEELHNVFLKSTPEVREPDIAHLERLEQDRQAIDGGKRPREGEEANSGLEAAVDLPQYMEKPTPSVAEVGWICTIKIYTRAYNPFETPAKTGAIGS